MSFSVQYGAPPAPNNVTTMRFDLWPLSPYITKITMAADSITLKRNIHQRLRVVKIQQQQK